MKRAISMIMVLFLLLSLSACSKQDSSIRNLKVSKTDFSKQVDIKTPEGIAYTSSMIYKNLADEKISVEEAIAELEKYSSKESLEALKKNQDEFRNQINDFISYLKANNDGIEKFEFAETVYVNSKEAYIERIQYDKSGSKYYFKQDFVLEDNEWKIRGDNVTDPFTIKKNSLFGL